MPTMDEYTASGGYANDAANGMDIVNGPGSSGYSGGGSSSSSSSSSNDSSSSGSDWQDRLNQYRTNTNAAQTEINRAKDVYAQKIAAGDTAGAQAAHTWADQVRAAAGISNYDPIYGGENRISNVMPNGYQYTPQAGTRITPDGSLRVTVDNNPSSDVVVAQGKSYVSVPEAANALGGTYTKDENGNFTITKDGKNYTVTPTGYDNNNNALVSYRDIAERMGYKVDYNDDTKTISIKSQQQPQAQQAPQENINHPMMNPGSMAEPSRNTFNPVIFAGRTGGVGGGGGAGGGAPGQNTTMSDPTRFGIGGNQPHDGFIGGPNQAQAQPQVHTPDINTLLQSMPNAPTYQAYQAPNYLNTLLSGAPTMPQLQAYQATDLSPYYNHLQQYNPWTGTMDQYTQQAQRQVNPTTQNNIDTLYSKQVSDIAHSDISMNRRGIFTSGIAQQVENDIRGRTTDAVAKVVTAAQAQIAKTAQSMYTQAFNEWSKGNDQVLKNNQMWLNQAQAAEKQNFSQWLQTQNLNLNQYKDALAGWDKMAVLAENDAKQAASDYFKNQQGQLNTWKATAEAWAKAAGLDEKSREFNDKLSQQENQFNQKMNEDQAKFNNLSAAQQATLDQKYNQQIQDWNKTMLPYNDLTKNQEATLNEKANQQQQDWQKALLPYNNLTMNQQGQLNQGQQKINIEQAAQQLQAYFKQMGYDLDVNKLQEAIRHNQATEQQASNVLNETSRHNQATEQNAQDTNRLKLYDMMGFDQNGTPTLKRDQLNETINKDAQTIQIAKDNATTTLNRSVIDGIGKELSSVNSQVSSIYNSGVLTGNDQGSKQTALNQLKQLSDQRDTLLSQLSQYTNQGFSSGK